MMPDLHERLPQALVAYLQEDVRSPELLEPFKKRAHYANIFNAFINTAATSEVNKIFARCVEWLPPAESFYLNITNTSSLEKLTLLGRKFSDLSLYISFQGIEDEEEQEAFLQQVLQACPRLSFLSVPVNKIEYSDRLIPDTVQEVYWICTHAQFTREKRAKG